MELIVGVKMSPNEAYYSSYYFIRNVRFLESNLKSVLIILLAFNSIETYSHATP